MGRNGSKKNSKHEGSSFGLNGSGFGVKGTGFSPYIESTQKTPGL
jgi:hypothetical protein